MNQHTFVWEGELALSVTATGLVYAVFPAQLGTPAAPVRGPGLRSGTVTHVAARVGTGSHDPGNARLLLYDDLTRYPNGAESGAAATALLFSTARQERLVYLGDNGSGAELDITGSATVCNWRTELDIPVPFHRGLWLVYEWTAGGTTGLSRTLRYHVRGYLDV